MDKEKISVKEYMENNDLLDMVYIPFDLKLDIVIKIVTAVLSSIGRVNSSILRRVSTETFIENISNIDLSIRDENNLSGYDQLCFHNELNNLISKLGNEYVEFQLILNEQIADYYRDKSAYNVGDNNESE